MKKFAQIFKKCIFSNSQMEVTPLAAETLPAISCPHSVTSVTLPCS